LQLGFSAARCPRSRREISMDSETYVADEEVGSIVRGLAPLKG
jgi:hypothetical protein